MYGEKCSCLAWLDPSPTETKASTFLGAPRGQVLKIFYATNGQALGSAERNLIKQGKGFGLDVEFTPNELPELAFVSRNGTFRPESAVDGKKYSFSSWLEDVKGFGVKVEFEEAEPD